MTIRTLHANGRKGNAAGVVLCLTPSCTGDHVLTEGKLLSDRYQKMLRDGKS